MNYYQCRLSQGDQRLVGWIEERGAKEGLSVEIKGEPGLWRVARVYEPPLDAAWLHEKQRRDRGSLKSLVPA